jgi:hypothetical protein
MVSEADAYALVTDVRLLLAARGHDTVITAQNAPWLVRAGALMLAAFGIGTTTDGPQEDS